ncbi:carbohydrate ABC transporter permease [Luteococcus peritonei]|uniref:Carbohydrate ABC transporter permease n=1 Tax=Luteococcus peritonei TaxID=88874 RepID=A0ABW4RUW4_9ACTN
MQRHGSGVVRAVPLLPALALLAIFLAGPIIWALYSSFTNVALTGRFALDPRFVGLANYKRLLSDPVFPKSVWLTVLFVGLSAVVGQNLLGIALAAMMRNVDKVTRAIVGTIVVAAWILPEIVAAFCLYAFFSDGGTLQSVFGRIGIHLPNMLYDHPMTSVILANVWRGTAFSMMVYAAALADVPPELTEAAEVDGASWWQRTWNVVLPTINRSIATNLMLTTLQTLSVFTLIWVMTAGGPGTNSSTLPILAYQVAFKSAKVGYGTAIATVMLLIGAIFSIVYIRMLRTGEAKQ